MSPKVIINSLKTKKYRPKNWQNWSKLDPKPLWCSCVKCPLQMVGSVQCVSAECGSKCQQNCLHYATLHYTKHPYTMLHYTTLNIPTPHLTSIQLPALGHSTLHTTQHTTHYTAHYTLHSTLHPSAPQCPLDPASLDTVVV